MKKSILILAVALLFAGTTATAQGWKDALKKAATTAADKATDGKLTGLALAGTWNYKGPGVKFEGGNIASEMSGAALESSIDKQLAKVYTMAGIKPGTCIFTFCDDKTFTAQLGSHALSGTYEFEASTHVVTLHFAKGKTNLGSIPGHAYISGSDLGLVFPITKFVEMIEKLGHKIESLNSIASMLEKYKNVYVGFAFTK